MALQFLWFACNLSLTSAVIPWIRSRLGFSAKILPNDHNVEISSTKIMSGGHHGLSCPSTLDYAISLAEEVLERDSIALPWLNSDREVGTNIGNLKVGVLLAAAYTSLIYSIVGHKGHRSNLVVKYLSNCMDLLDISEGTLRGSDDALSDSLVREYSIGAVLTRGGIAPRVRYISGLGTWNNEFTMEFPYDLRTTAMECKSKGSQVRFLVMDRVGPTMNEYFSSLAETHSPVVYITRVIEFGLEGLKVIEKMHARGVIHGDIHGGNIAFKNVQVDLKSYDPLYGNDLVLLDFGLSSFVCGPDDYRKSNNINLRMASMWQYNQNSLKGYRDDVFRFLELVSNYLSQGMLKFEIKQYITDLMFYVPYSISDNLFTMKRGLKYFCTNQPSEEFLVEFFEYDCLYLLPDGLPKTEIASYLEASMDYIKSIESDSQQVNFEIVFADFEKALNALQ